MNPKTTSLPNTITAFRHWFFALALSIVPFASTTAQVADIYTPIKSAHITTLPNYLQYYVELDMVEIAETTDEQYYFVRSEKGAARIYDGALEDGDVGAPCPNWKDMREPDEDWYLSNCTTKWYAHTTGGAIPLDNEGLIVDKTTDACGNEVPLLLKPHEDFDSELLFVSNMRTDSLNFEEAGAYASPRFPKWWTPDQIPIPTGFEYKEMYAYYYGKPGKGQYLIEVVAEGKWISPETEKFGRSGKKEWHGVYFLTPSGPDLITPLRIEEHIYFGEQFHVRGFADVNGDGLRDILIGGRKAGEKVNLVLIRHKKGFISHFFPFSPPGGC